jgi:hypothetical protein
MKRKRARRWAQLVGRGMISFLAPTGSVHFCLSPPSVVEQWPTEGDLWTPEPQLGKRDRRAWAAIEASLRDPQSGQ